MNVELINVIISIITTIPVIISCYIQLKGLTKRTFKKIKQRCEFYEKIITNPNKILKYTYFKEYIGFSISDEMIEYIINSTKFFDVISILKNIYSYIDFDLSTKQIIYKNKKQPKRKLITILYFIFTIPIILFISFFNYLLLKPEYLVTSIILIIPFTVIAIILFFEIGDRTLAIKLMDKLEKDKKQEENIKDSLPEPVELKSENTMPS